MALTPRAETTRERDVRRASAYLMTVVDMPLGVGLYLLGGWLFVAIQCVVFVVAAFVTIAWGACREVAGTTPPRLAADLARLWWQDRRS